MRDDVLREQFAEWARPVAQLPIPDIRVLRRRARRRGIRKAVTAAVVTAVVAAVGVGVGVGVGAGAGAGAGLPGKGRPAGGRPAASSSAAPVTVTHGRWQPAGPLPAADASPTVAPYIVLLPVGTGDAEVRNVYTFATVATIQPLPGQFMAGIAAAGDDRTFVVQAEVGGKRQEIRGKKVGPPMDSPTIAFDELRLSPDGRLISLVALFAVPAKDAEGGFAISQDASMLAYATGNGGIETVSLATGRSRSWPPVDGGNVSPLSLSWAGDRSLAFEWATGDNRHPPGTGLRLLNVTAPGTLLQASRLVVSRGRYCLAAYVCQDGQLITPDGSKLLATKVEARGQDYTDSVLEYSTRTGQALAALGPVVNTPYAGPPCVPLWTDPSGEQVMSFCGEHAEWFNRGHISQVTLHLPMYGLNFGAPFAW
jgi:hypothetical protein